jgi:magnesium chelatase subunit I
MSSLEYMAQAAEVGGLTQAIRKLDAQGNPALVASAMEFILEGLHLHRKLNKDRVAGSRGRFQFRG